MLIPAIHDRDPAMVTLDILGSTDWVWRVETLTKIMLPSAFTLSSQPSGRGPGSFLWQSFGTLYRTGNSERPTGSTCMVHPSGKPLVFKFLLNDPMRVGFVFGSKDNDDSASCALEVPED